MSGSMHGKSGLLTGAASGIGRVCAIRFAAEGAAVVVADLEAGAGVRQLPFDDPNGARSEINVKAPNIEAR